MSEGAPQNDGTVKQIRQWRPYMPFWNKEREGSNGLGLQNECRQFTGS